MIPNEGGNSQSGFLSNPAWLWTLVGGVMLVALLGGGVAGYEIGRRVEREQGGGVPTAQETYWLVGALLVDQGQSVLFQQIASGGPAASAGIQENDRLVAINGEVINNSQQARRMIRGYGAGQALLLTVERGSHFEQVTILLGGIGVIPPEPPIIIRTAEPYPLPPIQPYYDQASLGVTYRMLQPGDPFPVQNGAQIITVVSGAPASQAGLEVGDIILSLDSRALSASTTLEDALRYYRAGDVVIMQVWNHRDGKIVSLRVRL
jgi:serine protease Do